MHQRVGAAAAAAAEGVALAGERQAGGPAGGSEAEVVAGGADLEFEPGFEARAGRFSEAQLEAACVSVKQGERLRAKSDDGGGGHHGSSRNTNAHQGNNDFGAGSLDFGKISAWSRYYLRRNSTHLGRCVAAGSSVQEHHKRWRVGAAGLALSADSQAIAFPVPLGHVAVQWLDSLTGFPPEPLTAAALLRRIQRTFNCCVRPCQAR